MLGTRSTKVSTEKSTSKSLRSIWKANCVYISWTNPTSLREWTSLQWCHSSLACQLDPTCWWPKAINLLRTGNLFTLCNLLPLSESSTVSWTHTRKITQTFVEWTIISEWVCHIQCPTPLLNKSYTFFFVPWSLEIMIPLKSWKNVGDLQNNEGGGEETPSLEGAGPISFPGHLFQQLAPPNSKGSQLSSFWWEKWGELKISKSFNYCPLWGSN